VFLKALEVGTYLVLVLGVCALFLVGWNSLVALSSEGTVVERDGNRIVVRYPVGDSTIERGFDTEGLSAEPEVGQHITVYYFARLPTNAYLKGQFWETFKWLFWIGVGMLTVSVPFLLLVKRWKTRLPRSADQTL
jgi:hypothetical protein